MRTLLIVIVSCLLIVGGAGEAAASGFVDEMVLSSEWWAREEQRGEIEVFALGTYGHENLGPSYHFSLRQETKNGAVFVVNGNLDLDQLVVLNITTKNGAPELYYGFGGLIGIAESEQFVFLPRINLGGKFGPDLFKLVLDLDFYTLLIVNGGKLEIGMEFVPLENLRLYGGLNKLFTGTLVTSKLLPGSSFQIAAKYETKSFFLGGELYFVDEVAPIALVETGINLSILSLYARVGIPSQAAGEFGVYTVGVRLDY